MPGEVERGGNGEIDGELEELGSGEVTDAIAVAVRYIQKKMETSYLSFFVGTFQ